MRPLLMLLTICSTIVISRWIGVAGAQLKLPARVDTVRVETTVISRAKDTVRFRLMVKQVGPLTEQDVVRIACGPSLSYGDDRDVFSVNVYGTLFCPKAPKDKENQ